MAGGRFVRAAGLAELKRSGRLVVHVNGQTIALFLVDGRVYAVDNRCPHMGFPLHRGTVREGILTCHWHHARFDPAGGGTFDPWADDLRTFPVEVRGDEVWVDVSVPPPAPDRHLRRIREGLERNIPLVLAKAVIGLSAAGTDPVEAFRVGLDFGTRYRRAGWGSGLTTHTCFFNLLPYLAPEDRPLALYHGLSAVAEDVAGSPPRFFLRPLPGPTPDVPTLGRWFRQFVEVRDEEAAERCLLSAVRAGATLAQLAEMLFGSATDHRYLQVGHVLDFTNKAFEALEAAGPDWAEPVLASLVPAYARAMRMEEAASWRHPVDLVAILTGAFERLPAALDRGRGRAWGGSLRTLAELVVSAEPEAIADGLLEALAGGCPPAQLAQAVAYAAALRVARFPTSNEFADWVTALHTFSFANAACQAVRRSPTPEVLRAAFDAAMSVYLDRFLNIPAARLPEPDGPVADPEGLLAELESCLDRQQQVDEAGGLVGRYLYGGGDPGRLQAVLGRLLLREDRDFHTIQMVEAAYSLSKNLEGDLDGVPVLVGAARYLAAHAPTPREQAQTYRTALRLYRGERLYEEA